MIETLLFLVCMGISKVVVDHVEKKMTKNKRSL